jgi:Domain of unknown function (DUF4124)
MQTIVILLLLLAGVAQAQVNKCVHPKTGKVIYSDTRCDTSQSEKLLENRKSDDEIMVERMQAAQANERRQLDRANEMQPVPVAAQQTRPDKVDSYECRLALKNHETTTSINTNRNVINASIMKVNAICGTKTELIQPSISKSSTTSTPVNQPANITHCNSGFCYDDQGGVYHKGGPSFMVGPNGRTCNGAGNSWICN